MEQEKAGMEGKTEPKWPPLPAVWSPDLTLRSLSLSASFGAGEPTGVFISSESEEEEEEGSGEVAGGHGDGGRRLKGRHDSSSSSS